MTDTHYTYSTLRERIAEDIFVGDALRTLLRARATDGAQGDGFFA